MMNFTKYGVFLAGVLGAVAFFLPLIAVQHDGFRAELSTHTLVTGISGFDKHIDGLAELPPAARAEADVVVAELNSKLKEVRAVFVAIFIPSVVLALLGVLGVGLGRFGRGLGAVALVTGLAAVAIYAVLVGLIGEVQPADASLGMGAHLVAASGALGALFGLIALIKPELGYRPKGKRFKATLASRPPLK